MNSHLLALPMPTHDGKLSVYFSPRLHQAANLATYAIWKDWPTWSAANLSVTIELVTPGGGTTSITPPAPTVTPDPNVWKALFGDPNANPTPQLPVIPYQFRDQRFYQNVKSWGANDAFEALRSFYKGLAVAFPTNPPAAVQVTPSLVSNITAASNEFRSFVESLHDENGPDKTANPPPYWGFHEMVHMAGNHPHLLRLLGLVHDYDISVTGNPGLVRVLTNYSDQIPCAMQLASGFRALPNPNSWLTIDDDGWVNAGKFKLSNLDHSTGVHQIQQWTTQVQNDPDENGLPVPPAPGITVQLQGSKTEVEDFATETFARAGQFEDEIKNLTAGDELLLYRDDLVIGYRFDVIDDSATVPKWRSLFERQPIPGAGGSHYRFPGSFTVDNVPDDEGWVSFALSTEAVEPVTQPDPTDPDLGDWQPTAPQRFSPQFFVWDGWSAAAPRPGNVIDNDGDVVAPDKTENDPINGVGRIVGVNYRPVPGSLNQLRFGHSYRMRCRAVDIMGNSQPPGAGHPATAVSPSIVFGRTTPIPSPLVTRMDEKNDPDVNESVSQLVIKSEVPEQPSVTPTDRVFFPMPVIQRLLEQHGRPGDGDDPTKYNLLVNRDAKSIEDHVYPDPLSGERVVINNDPRPVISYWPDPGSSSIAFFGLPGSTGPVVVPADGTFPNFQAWRLRMASGTHAVKTNPGADTSVLVEVPQAIIADVQVSGVPFDRSHINLDDGTTAAVQAAIDDGRHWLAQGRSTVRLIHAVRIPLSIPVPWNVSADRTVNTDENEDPFSAASGLGALTAEIDLTVDTNAHSTGRVTCTGTWTDPVDGGPGSAAPGETNIDGDPGTITQSSEFGSLTVPYIDPNDSIDGSNMVLDLHDTKAHDVFVTVEAFSRFSEHFTEKAQFNFPDDQPVTISANGIAPGSVQVTDLLDGNIGRGQYTIDALNGTITPVTGGTLDGAGTVNVQFIPLPVSRLSTEAGGARPEVVVPASAPPNVPEIIEVLPSVSRDIRNEGGTTRIRHNGQVLRLQMKRPWWTSGRNERLAVLVESNSEQSTNVGRDPIFHGDGTDAHTTLEDWRRRTEEGIFDGLTIAAHDVTFDAANDLWVCDIELAGDFGYRPFIQPVIARFQPDAMVGAHLSSRVMLEPHRLGIMREVQVRRGQSSVAVTLTGPSNSGVTVGGQNHNEVTVTIQSVETGLGDPELRWIDHPTSTPLTLRRVFRADGWVNFTGKLPLPPDAGDLRLLIEYTEP